MMAAVGEDIARQILLKLPTTDLARCSCVCKLWNGIVHDPSFRTLHGNASHVISTSEAEKLLVQEFRGRGVGLEMTVLRVTSGKPMSRFTELDDHYRPVNACNGFLLLAPGVHDWPMYVCNPVTGEMLKIPAPPVIEQAERRTYAIGFNLSRREYKLFCLSFTGAGWPETYETYLDVCTLGTADGRWRRHQNSFRALYSFHPPPPPVLMDGKLYVVIEQPPDYYAPHAMMLVIDVASEKHGTYYLPEEATGSGAASVHAFNLRGQLCVATHISGRRRVNFWVMLSLRGKPHVKKWHTPDWERRHTFYLDVGSKCRDEPCCAWLDDRDGMLCYRFGDRLYKYDTTRKRKKLRIQLPVIPFVQPDHQQWNIYEGYRPSLLPPHLAFGSTSLLKQQRRKLEGCEQGLVHALGYQESSKKRCPSDRPNHLVRLA
jgi:F-box interacting protein